MNTPEIGNVVFSNWLRRNVVVLREADGAPKTYDTEDENGNIHTHYVLDFRPVPSDTKFNTWHTTKACNLSEQIKPWTNELKTTEIDLHVPGAKDDASKPPVGMVFSYFPRALVAVAEVANLGAKKYTRNGWIEVPNGMERYYDALGRHLLAQHIDGNTDTESGLLHLAHAAWNCLAVLELALRDNACTDD